MTDTVNRLKCYGVFIETKKLQQHQLKCYGVFIGVKPSSTLLYELKCLVLLA